MQTDDTLKTTICAALRRYIAQRPGFEFANYAGARDAYRADSRRATRQRHDAWALLMSVQHNPSITGARLADELSRGRLTWTGERLSFTTCQYYPTEYRAAACRVLSSILWDHVRNGSYEPTGDSLRAHFRREFGRGIAARWFN